MSTAQALRWRTANPEQQLVPFRNVRKFAKIKRMGGVIHID